MTEEERQKLLDEPMSEAEREVFLSALDKTTNGTARTALHELSKKVMELVDGYLREHGGRDPDIGVAALREDLPKKLGVKFPLDDQTLFAIDRGGMSIVLMSEYLREIVHRSLPTHGAQIASMALSTSLNLIEEADMKLGMKILEDGIAALVKKPEGKVSEH